MVTEIILITLGFLIILGIIIFSLKSDSLKNLTPTGETRQITQMNVALYCATNVPIVETITQKEYIDKNGNKFWY
jgi:hypothetical protein